MQAEVDFLRDQVHRLNSALSQYQDGHRPQTTSAVQAEETRHGESPAPWLSDRSIMAPLIAEYDRHSEEMAEQLNKYQVQMTDFKAKMERVVKENERLHAELRESVERQLQALPQSSGPEGGGTLGDQGVIQNLQEQITLSVQERDQAMELWQAAAQELDRLQQLHQTILSDGRLHVAERQQLKDQLIQFQQIIQKLQTEKQKLESTNQELLRNVMDQSTDVEELHMQLRQTKAELRTATSKVEEMTTVMQTIQDRMHRREEDAVGAQGREDASDRRLHQLQSALSQLEARLKAASQEVDVSQRQRAGLERQVGELQVRCGSLEEQRYEALAKVRESIQLAEEATLHKDQATLRDKQKENDLEKMKEGVKQLIRDAAVRTRKEVQNVRKQCNVQIVRMAEELSALQLECADKESQIERCRRERKAVEEELEKVYREGRAEPEYRKIEALHQRCLNAERLKDDMNITLQSTQSKLKKMEMEYGEELSRSQEEVRRLQACLVSSREECGGVSEERLTLQQENLQLRREVEETRKSSLLATKRAKLQVSQMEHEYSLKEQGLEARLRELEESNRISYGGLSRLLSAHQKSGQRWKEEAKNLAQALESKVTSLKAELNRQKQRTQELELELEANHEAVVEHERQMVEYQEKNSRLQRRLTQAEQRATTAVQQLSMLTSQRRTTSALIDS